MYWGVDTRRAFIGHCPTLAALLEKIIDAEYGPDGDFRLRTILRLELVRGIGGQEVNRDRLHMVETLYYAIDDPILKHAIDQDHLWNLVINERGHYMANCLTKGY